MGTGVLIAGAFAGQLPALAQLSSPGPDAGIYPVVPDVDEAWTAMFANADGETQFSAPVSLRFWSFAFADEEVSAANFNAIATFYQDYLKTAGGSVKHLSLGKFGDDRKAYSNSSDGLKVASIIRVGAVVQVALGLAFGGDLTDEITTLLEDTLPSSDKDAQAFIPTLDDLPDGFAPVGDADPVEITKDVQG